jgi:hypothetical protein
VKGERGASCDRARVSRAGWERHDTFWRERCRGKGKGGGVGASSGAGHRVLSVDPRMKPKSCEVFWTGMGYSDGDGEQADGDGFDVTATRVPPPREVDYVRGQRGPATCWVDLKEGGGEAKYVALTGSHRKPA